MTALATPFSGNGCAVRGAGGFIGTNLCRRLIGRGWRVHASVTASCRWFEGRMADRAQLRRALAGMHTVVHLASPTAPIALDMETLEANAASVADAERLMADCVDLGVRRIVFLSSGGALYASNDSGVHVESSALYRSTSYALTRLAIEDILTRYHTAHGIETIILRVASAYGPHQRSDGVQGVVGRFLNLALTGQPLPVWRNGSDARYFIFVEDVVDAVEAAMTAALPYGIVNIGTGIATSIDSLVDRICGLVNIPPVVDYVPGPSASVHRTMLDISAAASLLSWQPRTELDRGLRLTLDWLRGRMGQAPAPQLGPDRW